MKNDSFEVFLKETKTKYFKDYPACKITTFGVGGKVKFLVYVQDFKNLKKIISKIKEENLSYFILGRGANLLFSDKGFNGVVLNLQGKFRDFSIRSGILFSGSGAFISRVSLFTILRGYRGFENFLDLPGTIGGGLIMNAGCYGKEISENLISVKILDENLKVKEIEKKEISFSYRKSGLKGKGIILSSKFEIKKGKVNEILKVAFDILKKRKGNIPEGKSAGSIFKNPEGFKARDLLVKTGLSGFHSGGAKFSEKHPNIIINYRNARAEDIYNLIKIAKERVYNKFDVMLDEEIIYVGF